MKKSLIAFAVLCGSFAQAQADTITFTADKLSARTPWNTVLSLGKFDTNLGTLTSIDFSIAGTVRGTGRVENTADEAQTVTLSLGSVLTLKRPDGSTLVVTNPVFSQSFDLGGFDGVSDYAGTSGASTGLQTASKQDQVSSTVDADFTLFSQAGGGTIGLGVTSNSASKVIGSGNEDTSFMTFAAGTASVTYNYTVAAVPEPESYAMLLGGLGLLAFARRRQAKKSA